MAGIGTPRKYYSPESCPKVRNIVTLSGVNDPHGEVLAYVAAEVRAELARRRMTVRETADLLGWGVTATHRRIFTGQSPLDVGRLWEVASKLAIPVERFFPEPEQGSRMGKATVPSLPVYSGSVFGRDARLGLVA